MPDIYSGNHMIIASEQEFAFLKKLVQQINNRYLPAKINLTYNDLADFYYENKEKIVKALQLGVEKIDIGQWKQLLDEFEQNAGYPVTKYLSVKDNHLWMYNTNNNLFNILLAFSFMTPISFKQLAETRLKDKSIFTPIKDVIKDRKILSLIFPGGYEKETVYSFLKLYSLKWDDKKLSGIEGIGPISLTKIKQAMADFGYPLIIGNMSQFSQLGNNMLDSLLLSTSQDLKNAGMPSYVLDVFKNTKYINNVKTAEKFTSQKTESAKPKTTAPKPQAEEVKLYGKYKALDVLEKLPPSLTVKALEIILKENLEALLALGKDDPQLLLDYAHCIDFSKFKKEKDIPAVFQIIRVQPKLIRKLDPKMLYLIYLSDSKKLKSIVKSNILTKAESDSLNAYVTKSLQSRHSSTSLNKNR